MKPILVVTLFLMVLAACQNRSSRFNMDVAVDVTVQTVSAGPVREMVTVTGDLMPAASVTLKNEMSGTYLLQNNPATGQPFKMGDPVDKGMVVIKLEDKAYRNTTNIEGERINLEIAEQEYEKHQALFEKGGVTRRELVNAEKNLVTARKTYENAQLNLDKMSVKAPFNGVITALPYYSQDVKIEQGQEMVGIMDFDQLVLDITLPAQAFGKVVAGQEALITNYAASSDTIEGVVTQLSPVLNVETRSFKGRMSVTNHNQLLRPGMFVNADIVVQQKDSVLTVPPEVCCRKWGVASFTSLKEKPPKNESYKRDWKPRTAWK
ncbi:efflux RND transporter periplasmic adaptor subunit [Geofilum rubicundum]|nr:efflux RND transporter periplasmic adaptor subunit [Geofilum rubicundum]